ncbi:2-amino-4-hydroxy-6-hydroxymethyldihydropteridine diphosphokinase [Tateyamaria sp.]|uniref:2-amino-4-hydroxy-6- hydroxymethyldihydropteridine diphosphokinase n=1 Tax=Tateyamaria sp. TaxID=1929288 RepID=UPI0039B9307B
MPQDTDALNRGGKPPIGTSQLLVALGSNMISEVGTPIEALQQAVIGLERAGAVIRAQSPFYTTPAMPVGIGADFVNAALVIEVSWALGETLMRMHEIEAQMGRRRVSRWGERVVDIDLLAVGDKILPNMATLRTWMDLAPEKQRESTPEQLILPHPRMHERAFVLVPLADVAPDWVHPVTRRTVVEMRDALPPSDLEAISRLQ